MKKDIKSITRSLRQQGFQIRTTKRGHHLVLKNGVVITSIAGTPSDYRSIRNSLAALRRAGFTYTKFA